MRTTILIVLAIVCGLVASFGLSTVLKESRTYLPKDATEFEDLGGRWATFKWRGHTILLYGNNHDYVITELK